MNEERRKKITAAKAILEDCLNEETQYKEDMPEGLANSQKGDDAQSNIDALQEAVDALDNIT